MRTQLYGSVSALTAVGAKPQLSSIPVLPIMAVCCDSAKA
jgi:hypothetical protein